MKKLVRLAATLGIVVAAGMIGGCTSTESDSPEPAATTRSVPKSERAQIYLFRGAFFGVFSTGLDNVADMLEAKNIKVNVVSWTAQGAVTSRIKSLHRSGKPVGPVIIGGHSAGAGSVVGAMRELTDAGITVDLAMVFDSLGASPVPKGVRKFISFKASGNKKKAGSYTAAPGFNGKLVNIDIRTQPGMENANHFDIVNQKALEKRIAREIETAYRRHR